MQHFNQRQHSQEHFNLESQKMKKSTSEKVFKDLFAHNYRYGEPQRVINPNANK